MADAIVAVLQAGDAAEAARLCREQLRREPEAPELLVLLALAQWRLGMHDESLEIYARLTRMHPRDVVYWRNYATALREAGDLVAAEAASATALRLAPDDTEWLEWHGLLQLDAGKPTEARDTLMRAFGKAPDRPSIRIHAAQACSACRDARADNLLRPWRSWMPLDDALQSELVEVLRQQGEIRDAMELLEGLVGRWPSEWRLRLRLAALYERVNRLDEAEALLDRIVAEGVVTGTEARAAREIEHQRARLAVRRREFATARDIIEHAGPHDDRHCAHWFELGQACDKTGDTVAAMTALARAHEIQLADIRRSHPRWLETGAKVMPGQNPRVAASDFAAWPTLRAPDASQSPVFVVGFPRSGTTLLEQMLDAHPRLQSMDERPFFNTLATQLENSTGFEIPRDLGRLDQRDCDELRKGYLILACGKVPRRWDARLVDKNPMNMLWLPMMYRMFPAAKFILAVRHPCDVLLSCYMQNFMSSSLAVVCENLEILAQAYVDAMRHWLYHVDLFKPDVFVSRYETLVADTPGQTRRIAEFLGLDDAESMLGFAQHARGKGFIATPSYTQVIEPINRKGLGRWQRYREYFEPVLPALQPMLEYWGYATNSTAAAMGR
ncbi:MAG TPA: sulfotransferase [Rhodanobacteraceae bacterium]|nr:sulfotransferase [Rhodanobacteraceae bacterium]